MLTRRPNPFMLGIVIGAMLHLLVLPWLTQTPANAQTGPLDDSDESGVVLDGVHYLVDTVLEAEVVRDIDGLRRSLFDAPAATPGDVVDFNHLLVGDFDTLNIGDGPLPGDWFGGAIGDGLTNVADVQLQIIETLHLDIDTPGVEFGCAWAIIHTGATSAIVFAYVLSDADGSTVIPVREVDASDAGFIAFGAVHRLVEDGVFGEREGRFVLQQFAEYGVTFADWILATPEPPSDTMRHRLGPDDGARQTTATALVRQCQFAPGTSQQAIDAYNQWIQAARANYRLCMQAAQDHRQFCLVAALGAAGSIEILRRFCKLGPTPVCLKAIGLSVTAIAAATACEACYRSKIRQCSNWLQQNQIHLCTQVNTGRIPTGLQNTNTTPTCL